MGVVGKACDLLSRPDEAVALARAYALSKRAKAAAKSDDPDVAFCYGMLNRVSRSFAMVIQQLSPELRTPVCVFYLVRTQGTEGGRKEGEGGQRMRARLLRGDGNRGG